MLAAVGFLVGESVEPLMSGVITSQLAINQFQQVPAGFEAAVTLALGIAEAGRVAKGWADPASGLFQLKESYAPGDLGFDPLRLLPLEPTGVRDMKTRELNNGRLGAQQRRLPQRRAMAERRIADAPA